MICAKEYNWHDVESECGNAIIAIIMEVGSSNKFSSLVVRYGRGDLSLGGEGAGLEGQCPPAHRLGSRPCSCQGCSVACDCRLLSGMLHTRQGNMS